MSDPAKRRAYLVSIASALALALLAPIPARADLNQLTSALPRPMALAGAYTALADDAGALYYNPAGLSAVDGSYITVAFHLAVPHLRARFPDGSDASLDPPSDTSYGIHLAWSPKDLLNGDLGFGFSVLLPHRRALEFEVHPFEDPFFVLYENNIDLLEIRLGVAYDLFDMVSIGGGMLLLAGLDGLVRLEAPFQDADDLDPEKRTVIAMRASLPNREFFNAGIQVRPIVGLRLGLTYREPTFVRIALPIDFSVALFDLEPIRTIASVDVRVKYAPAQLTFGGAYQLTPSLLLSADVAFARFSRYELPTGSVELERVSVEGIELLPPREPKASLRDVWIPRIGAEWAASEALVLRTGYAFLRSFIRSTDAPILDSDKHAITAGAGYDLGSLFLEAKGTRLVVLGGAQLLLFTRRDTSAHAHSGQVFAGTLGAELFY